MQQAITITPENAARVIRAYGGTTPEPVANVERGLILGLYGPGGIGKTTLSATITDSPLGSPALYLDARGNPHVISSYADRIDVIRMTDFKHQEKVRQDILKDKEFPYKSIILDNVSELFYMNLRDLYGAATDVDWTKHSATTADVLQLVRNWVDLAEGPQKVNVVFVFQETPENRTIRGAKVEGRSEIAFNKALQFQVPTIINWLGRIYQIEDTPPFRRMLDFTPVETMHQSKIQIDPKDEFARQVPYEIYNPSLASILDTVRGHQPWPAAKHVRSARPDREAKS